jgi:hypothetical protein
MMKENDIDSFKHYKQQQMNSTNKILEHLFGNKKKQPQENHLKNALET